MVLAVGLAFQFRAPRYVPGIYWLAVVLISIVGPDNLTDDSGVSLELTTVLLGTAAGDLVAETLDVGYWRSAVLFAAAIAVVTLAWRYAKMNPILAFWIAYILTRPLGASLGDFLSQPRGAGGLALGTAATSGLFLVTITAVVAYLTRTGKDQVEIVVAG